jgi:hypothetical protein
MATDAEVIAVASQASTERGVLCLDRLMPVATTPVVDGLFGPSEACPPCLAPHPPVTLTGTCPIERKSQKVEGGRPFPTLWCLWRTPKGPQPGFVRVQGQSEAPSPFAEYCHSPPCIVLTLKADDEVVTIANQGRFALKPRLHCGLKPPVEHVVQGDIPQQR